MNGGLACWVGPSPRVRGAAGGGRVVEHAVGSIPAGAGSSSTVRRASSGRWVHPRGCGEQSTVRRGFKTDMGPSPRVRGAVLLTCGFSGGRGCPEPTAEKATFGAPNGQTRPPTPHRTEYGRARADRSRPPRKAANAPVRRSGSTTARRERHAAPLPHQFQRYAAGTYSQPHPRGHEAPDGQRATRPAHAPTRAP